MTQAESVVPTPRRPLRDDPDNPLSDWLSGKLAVRHPNGNLRRGKTLWKFAWCVALLGHDEDQVVDALRERDAQPEYRKWARDHDAGEYRYRVIARQVIRNHEQWARRQARKAEARPEPGPPIVSGWWVQP